MENRKLLVRDSQGYDNQVVAIVNVYTEYDYDKELANEYNGLKKDIKILRKGGATFENNEDYAAKVARFSTIGATVAKSGTKINVIEFLQSEYKPNSFAIYGYFLTEILNAVAAEQEATVHTKTFAELFGDMDNTGILNDLPF